MSDAVIIDRGGDFRRVAGHVDKPDDLAGSAMLIIMVKGCGETLERHYPGWRWGVRADEHNGIVDIFAELINAKWGYTLHIPRVQADPRYRRVVNAGGEYLERFGFKRVGYSPDEWRRRELVHGQFLPDVSDQPLQVRRRARADMVKTGMANGSVRIAINPSIGAALSFREAQRYSVK